MAASQGCRMRQPLASKRTKAPLLSAEREAPRGPALGGSRNSALRILLLLAGLVIAQSALLLHGVDHDLHPHHDACVVCLVGNHVGHALIAAAYVLPSRIERTAEFPSVNAALPRAAALAGRARGPPAQLLV
jgi:hypothetical protein